MLIIISPAKTLDYQSPLATTKFSQPEMLDKSQALIDVTNGAIVIHTQRLKSDPGGNLLS